MRGNKNTVGFAEVVFKAQYSESEIMNKLQLK